MNLYEEITNNISIIRKKILYEWYYDYSDIVNIKDLAIDCARDVIGDAVLKTKFMNVTCNVIDIEKYDYRDVIDRIDKILSKLYVWYEKKKIYDRINKK